MGLVRGAECVTPPRTLFILMKTKKQSEIARRRKHPPMEQQILEPQRTTAVQDLWLLTLRKVVSIAPLSWLGELSAGTSLFPYAANMWVGASV